MQLVLTTEVVKPGN